MYSALFQLWCVKMPEHPITVGNLKEKPFIPKGGSIIKNVSMILISKSSKISEKFMYLRNCGEAVTVTEVTRVRPVSY